MPSVRRLFHKLADMARHRPKRSPRATWGVVATVKEPPDLIVPFVCHHLAQDAASVRLYLDDPQDPSFELLAQIEGVELIRCDAAYWRGRGFDTRPTRQQNRQVANLRHAVMTTPLDWVMHLDADEFLWLPNGMGAELSALKPGHNWLAIRPAERFWPGEPRPELFGGMFRDRLPDPATVKRVYGDEARYIMPNGMAGYATYRPLIPARTPHEPKIHHLGNVGGGGLRPFVLSKTARVLHFEGLTPVHWALKQLRYAAQSDETIVVRGPRYLAVRQIIEADDVVAAALERFRRTYVFAPELIAALEREGAVFQAVLDIAAAVAKHAPSADVDLTGRRIDATLAPIMQEVAADVTARREALLRVRIPGPAPTRN